MAFPIPVSINEVTMQEVYFRLKDKEETWENLADQFGQSKYNKKGIPVANLEDELLKALRHAGPGRVTKPITINEQVVVAELEYFTPSSNNKELRNKILRDEFDEWVENECERLLKQL
mgnify:FL=1